jgi:hypothetical protein
MMYLFLGKVLDWFSGLTLGMSGKVLDWFSGLTLGMMYFIPWQGT